MLYEAVVEMLKARAKEDPVPFLKTVHTFVGKDCRAGCLISLVHSYLMHSNIGLLLNFPP